MVAGSSSSPGSGDDSSSNPFVRFKNNVDKGVQKGVHTLFGSSIPMDNQYGPPSGERNGAAAAPTPIPTPTAAADDVFSWAVYSPYSPLNLQHLPQPVPNDTPRAWRNLFTFRDAFEDLLTASSGDPLPTTQELLLTKALDRTRSWLFLDGLHVEDWILGLGNRRLWDAFFPLSPAAKYSLSRGFVPSSCRTYLTQDMTFHPQPSTSTLRELLGTDSSNWSQIWEWAHSDTRGDHTPVTKPKSEGASSEEDLYAIFSSDFAREAPVRAEPQSTRHLDPLTQPAQSTADEADDHDTSQVVTTRTILTPDGGRVETTTSTRESDEKKEVTTVEKRFDADGNLVAHSKTSSTSRTYSSKGSWGGSLAGDWPTTTATTTTGTDTSHNKDRSSAEKARGNPTGWFWR
ncbi:hypothetical protein F4778DRAFT_585876 [Xylariomycetidae sp. FL2044]|nr:hypothetical protein F4778DRAFT_585876 [Xylariomycetidae sp. FL2044]